MSELILPKTTDYLTTDDGSISVCKITFSDGTETVQLTATGESAYEVHAFGPEGEIPPTPTQSYADRRPFTNALAKSALLYHELTGNFPPQFTQS